MPSSPSAAARRFVRTLGLVGVGVLPSVPAVAQSSISSAAPGTARDSAPASASVVRPRDVVTLGAFATTALALAPTDRRIARWSQRPSLHDTRMVDRTASFVRALGGPGAVAIPALTYGVGLVTRDRTTAGVGLHAGEAVVAATVASSIIKAAVGRARPYVSHDSDAASFGFARGLRRGDDYQSLPSGHATASFALAAALAGEGRVHWARVNRFTGPLGFGIATLVAASRVYHDAHWASDVVAGAGLGTVVGGAADRYARTHPGAWIERRFLPSVGGAGGSATAVGYALPF